VGKNLALLVLRSVGLVCRAKQNVPNAGWLKIVFKKCAVKKNKKHWVGLCVAKVSP